MIGGANVLSWETEARGGRSRTSAQFRFRGKLSDTFPFVKDASADFVPPALARARAFLVWLRSDH